MLKLGHTSWNPLYHRQGSVLLRLQPSQSAISGSMFSAYRSKANSVDHFGYFYTSQSGDRPCQRIAIDRHSEQQYTTKCQVAPDTFGRKANKFNPRPRNPGVSLYDGDVKTRKGWRRKGIRWEYNADGRWPRERMCRFFKRYWRRWRKRMSSQAILDD